MSTIPLQEHASAETQGLSFLLASLLVSYPDQNFRESLKRLLAEPRVIADMARVGGAAWTELASYLTDIVNQDDAIHDLRSLYVDVFERSRPGVSLYETEYGLGRSLAKGPELLDIAHFYQSFGFNLGEGPESREMVDHLGVELEFYALMDLKLKALKADGDRDGVEIVDAARRRFLKDHLGSFTGSILQRPNIGDSAFYHCALSCVDALIVDACERLGIERTQRPWQDDLMREEDEISCGGLGCLAGNPQTLASQVDTPKA